jgi:hypothetical protein
MAVSRLDDEADACLLDIKAHLRTRGERGLSEVRARHPNIGERRFYRLLSRAKESPTVRGLELSRAITAVAELKEMIPAEALSTAPPALATKPLPGSVDAINLMATLRDLMVDATMVREYAMSKPDENGNRTIKNPMYFANSVKLRRDLVETMLKTWHESFDLRRMQEFYEIILDEIGKASPEVQGAIMERLRELNSERGFAFGG